MVSVSPPVCDFGRPAVDFDLPGVDGRRHSLASARGPNGLLVMFICNHCPYVKAVLDRLLRDTRELGTLGVGSIAIMSNDPTDYPEDSWDNMVGLARGWISRFPMCWTKARRWPGPTARCARPDFFGYNAKLELQYRGRLDASRKEAAAPDARRELFEAMRAGRRDRAGPARADARHRLLDQVAPGVKCASCPAAALLTLASSGVLAENSNLLIQLQPGGGFRIWHADGPSLLERR
jgi:hypothetical protein